MSKFLTELRYKPSEREGYYLLTKDLIYESELAGGLVITTAGFETNFVTGRKLLVVRRIVQDKMNDAAVIHDTLYGNGSVPRSVADDVFYEAMIVSGVARWRAYSAWLAVRVFGGKFYQPEEKKAA